MWLVSLVVGCAPLDRAAGGPGVEVVLDVGEGGAFFGLPVAAAGDVDGDGYDDVLVGTREGPSRRYRGGPGGVDPVAAEVLQGSTPAGVGDVNGDGIDDVVVGDPAAGDGGAAFVHLGSPIGLLPWSVLALPGTTRFGGTVEPLGDANDDGYADFAVGQPYVCGCSAGGGTHALFPGAVHVWYGSADGVSATPAFTVQGDTDDVLGAQIAGPGDVDGDGFDDLAIGVTGYAEVWVYRGSPTGYAPTPDVVLEGETDSFGFRVAGLGDADGDGADDLVVEDLDGTSFVYHGGPDGLALAQVIETSFNDHLFGVGDVTGDGVDDVALGHPHEDDDRGAVCVLAGGPGDLDPSTCAVRFAGTRAGSWFGVAIAHVGDTDGDGTRELAIGAPDISLQPNVGDVVIVDPR